jgi:hypothetical protein
MITHSHVSHFILFHINTNSNGWDDVAPANLRVRVTMGTNVDYFKPVNSLCAMLTTVGSWYFHSYVGENGPWQAVNGNHSALLGGFFPYQSQDTRVWGK